MYFIAEIYKMPSVAADSTTQPILCLLECDTVSDLPAQPATGYNWIVGSKAHVVQDNTMYAFKSSGTWVIQDEASRMNVYTKDETDQAIEDAIDTAEAAQAIIDGSQDTKITNLELSAKILLSDISPVRLGSGVGNIDVPIDLSAGQYYIHFGSIISTDTDYTTCQVIALNGNTVVSASPQLQSSRGYNQTGVIIVNSAANKLQIYASRTGTASANDSVSFTGLTIAPKES